MSSDEAWAGLTFGPVPEPLRPAFRSALAGEPCDHLGRQPGVRDVRSRTTSPAVDWDTLTTEQLSDLPLYRLELRPGCHQATSTTAVRERSCTIQKPASVAVTLTSGPKLTLTGWFRALTAAPLRIRRR